MITTYIIKNQKYYKIGKTGNLEQRLRTFNTSFHTESKLIYAFPFDCEKELHKIYTEHRVRGE